MSRFLVSVLASLGLTILAPYLCSAGSEGSPAVPWPKAAKNLVKEADSARKEALLTRELMEDERKRLLEERNKLRAEVALRQEELEKLKRRFKGLLKKEEDLQARLAAHEEEIKAIQGNTLSFARDALTLVRNSLATPEIPGREGRLKAILNPDRFPSFEDIRSLVDILFEEMRLSGEISLREGRFIGSDGREIQGRILRAGEFTAYYQRGNTVGFLKLTGDGRELIVVGGEPSWSVEAAIEAYMRGQGEVLPLDPSGGTLFEKLYRKRTVQEWLKAGGPLVWPILLIGLVALVLVVERLVFLGRLRTNTDDIMASVRDFARERQFRRCIEVCKSHPNALSCKVIEALIQVRDGTREVMESAMEDAILREMPSLERFLSTLSVLAAISPMLGLLGTVTGMINTFQVITLFGTGDPRLMSGGISEALITTQLGLGMALPLILFHHFLERRVERILQDMEEKGAAFAVILLKGRRNPGHEGDSR